MYMCTCSGGDEDREACWQSGHAGPAEHAELSGASWAVGWGRSRSIKSGQAQHLTAHWRRHRHECIGRLGRRAREGVGAERYERQICLLFYGAAARAAWRSVN